MKRKEFLKSGVGMAILPGFIKPLPNIQQETEWANAILEAQNTNNWSKLRKAFSLNNKFTYLNNGTMGLVPKYVHGELVKAFEKVANRGLYPNNLETLKKELASLVGTKDVNIAITKNVTEGVNLAAWNIPLKQGDIVLMTKHEHIGGCAAWLHKEKQTGAIIKTFELGNTAEETLNNFKNSIQTNTKVIAIPHIPCTTGQILPITEMVHFANSRNIVSVIDGAHPLGMIQFDIEKLDCDFYVGCMHKWLLAPLGLGFFYCKPEWRKKMDHFQVGAYSVGSFDMTAQPPQMAELVDNNYRFTPGTYCGPLHDAGIAAINWYKKIGPEIIEKRVKELGKYTQDSLKQFSQHLQILTPSEDISRGAQTAFKFNNKKCEDFVAFSRLTPFNIITRPLHEANLNAIRISTHYYNSEKDIDKLCKAIASFIAK